MNYLISSIKQETSKLKRNLTENVKTRYIDPVSSEKLSPMSSQVPLSSTKIPLAPQETIRTDITTTKLLIENLIQDNKMLHEDIEDFKMTLEILVDKLKDTKRELEVEKLKNARIDILEQQIIKEQNRKQGLLQQHLKLKEKYLGLVSTMRDAAFHLNEEDKEDITLHEKLCKENARLKEMLTYSKISDPRANELEKVNEVEEVENDKYKETLRNYREHKIAMKRSKSFAVVGRKNYLLMSPKEKNNPNNVWDNFFKKHEQKSNN